MFIRIRKMKTLSFNTKQTAFFHHEKEVKNKIPTAEEYPEAFALFAGICKSEKFTIDNVHRAFSEALRKND
jgi:hypothetical protein